MNLQVIFDVHWSIIVDPQLRRGSFFKGKALPFDSDAFLLPDIPHQRLVVEGGFGIEGWEGEF